MQVSDIRRTCVTGTKGGGAQGVDFADMMKLGRSAGYTHGTTDGRLLVMVAPTIISPMHSAMTVSDT